MEVLALLGLDEINNFHSAIKENKSLFSLWRKQPRAGAAPKPTINKLNFLSLRNEIKQFLNCLMNEQRKYYNSTRV